jgi:hypothetical protein
VVRKKGGLWPTINQSNTRLLVIITTIFTMVTDKFDDPMRLFDWVRVEHGALIANKP